MTKDEAKNIVSEYENATVAEIPAKRAALIAALTAKMAAEQMLAADRVTEQRHEFATGCNKEKINLNNYEAYAAAVAAAAPPAPGASVADAVAAEREACAALAASYEGDEITTVGMAKRDIARAIRARGQVGAT